MIASPRLVFCSCVAMLVGAALTSEALAVVVAADNSGQGAYNDGWSTGDNGGSGFTAWTLQSSGNAGHFQSPATDNDNGGPPVSATIDAGNDSFGMYANSGGHSAAYRGFNLTGGGTSLPIGSTFRWSMDNGSIDTTKSVGLVLRSGNASGDASSATLFSGSRFAFEFEGGQSNYKIIDSTAPRYLDQVPFRRTGLTLQFTLSTADTYSFAVTDVVTGDTKTFTGSLVGTAGSAISSFAIYNRDAGFNGHSNVYFNNFEVNAVPEVSSLVAAPFAAGIASLVWMVRVRRNSRAA